MISAYDKYKSLNFFCKNKGSSSTPQGWNDWWDPHSLLLHSGWQISLSCLPVSRSHLFGDALQMKPVFLLFICLMLILFSLIFISWRLITLQYCSGFCHTLTWISHGFTCIPHPNPPSHLPLHTNPLGLPSAPGPSTCFMHPTWAGDLIDHVDFITKSAKESRREIGKYFLPYNIRRTWVCKLLSVPRALVPSSVKWDCL